MLTIENDSINSVIVETTTSKLTKPEGEHHKRYMRHNNKIRIYRGVFVLFGIFFALLGAMIALKSTNWICSLYFQNCAMIKAYAYSFCHMLSFSSFTLSYFIKPELATTDEITGQYKKNLERFYKDLKSHHPQEPILNHFYYKTLNVIEEKKQTTLQRLEWIKQASNLDAKTRKVLSLKALFEYHDKLKKALHHFRAETLSNMN